MGEVRTPAYVFDEETVVANLEKLSKLARASGLTTLYSLKAACEWRLLSLISGRVDGFSASSLFETRLCRSISDESEYLHLTSPGLGPGEVEALHGRKAMVSFNSLEQTSRLAQYCSHGVGIGLRVNPGVSLVDDLRYDPSHVRSKLGVPLAELRSAREVRDRTLDQVEGLHFHTNCEARSYQGLLRTAQQLVTEVPEVIERVKWVNVGGGYLFTEAQDIDALLLAVDLLKSRECQVFFEPGAGVVQEGAYLVTEVVDLFRRDGTEVAVLDTSVGHWPEVFEYQFQPDLYGDNDENEFEYLLAGCTCLAGDVFGRYALADPLRVGSRVAFTGAGAYSFVKASYFNGVNLPSVYWLESNGDLVLTKRFTFDDFLARNGAIDHVPV